MKISKFLKLKIFLLLFIYAGFSILLFIYSIVTLSILHLVTALADLSNFISCGFLQFNSRSFLINILSSREIFNLQLISPMF